MPIEYVLMVVGSRSMWFEAAVKFCSAVPVAGCN